MVGMMEEAGCYPVSSFLFIETWKTLLNTGLEERKGSPIKHHWGVTMLRKIISLTTFFSFVLLIISSVMLYVVPEGRVAYWADWRIIFTKAQWGDLHITGGALFLVAGLWHTFLNWKPVMNYIRGAKEGSRKPLLAAALICLFVYAGTLLEIPPMQQLVGWNDAIKDYQARKYGEPPFGHAETSSLKQFSAFLGLDSDLILQKMREADFKGEPKPESIFIDIATSNDMTPQELFSFIMKSTGATMPVRGSGKGQGKGQAAQ